MNIRRPAVAAGVLALLFAIAPRASAQTAGSIDPNSASFFGGVGGTVVIRPHGYDGAVDVERQGTLPDEVTATKTPENANDGSLTITVPKSLPLGTYFFDINVKGKDAGSTVDDTFKFTLFVSQAKAPPPDIAPATCATLNADLGATTKFKQGETMFVRGFLPAVGQVTVFLGETPVALGTGGTDDSGIYLVTAIVPFIPPGPYTLVTRGIVNGEEVRATCGINITSATPAAAAASAAGTSGTGTGTSGTSGSTNGATTSSTSGAASSAALTTPTVLPATGAPVVGLSLMGFTLLELGAALWIISRRHMGGLGPVMETEGI